MYDWMNLMNSRRRQEFPLQKQEEPHPKNTAGEFYLHHRTCHLCSALCHMSPEAVTPFDLSPHQVCGPVWTAHDSCLLFEGTVSLASPGAIAVVSMRQAAFKPCAHSARKSLNMGKT